MSMYAVSVVRLLRYDAFVEHGLKAGGGGVEFAVENLEADGVNLRMVWRRGL